jgi:hypothetical protein
MKKCVFVRELPAKKLKEIGPHFGIGESGASQVLRCLDQKQKNRAL